MESGEILKILRDAINQCGSNPYRIAKNAGLPDDALRYVLAGHEPKAGRLADICHALGLEFYIGPPRSASPSEVQTLSNATLPSEMERPLQDFVRAVVRAGGNPIPDDLVPVIIERAGIGESAEATPDATPETGPADDDDAVVVLPFARDVRAAAGTGEEVFDEAGVNLALPRDELPRGAHPDHAVALRVQGDAMEPTIHSGDILVIDHHDREPMAGRVYVLRTETGLVAKRLCQDAGAWIMTSDNEAAGWLPRPVGPEDRVLGRVIWFGPEKTMTVG